MDPFPLPMADGVKSSFPLFCPGGVVADIIELHINHSSGVKNDHFFLEKRFHFFGKDAHAQLLFKISQCIIHISRFNGTGGHRAFLQPGPGVGMSCWR